MRVFQNHRFARVDTELAGGSQEHLWVGFAVREVAPGDIGVEELQHKALDAPTRTRCRALARTVKPDWARNSAASFDDDAA